MKLLFVQSSPASCYCLSLGPEYTPKSITGKEIKPVSLLRFEPELILPQLLYESQ
jgi:hypothetical protein